MSKRNKRQTSPAAPIPVASNDGEVVLAGRMTMPEFGAEAVRFLEESRRLVSGYRTMERVGGSRFRRTDKDVRPL